MSAILQKNQEKTINDLGGSSPIMVVGVGWHDKKDNFFKRLLGKQKSTDLDLSCAMYDSNNDRIDCVWYAQLKSKCGAVRHRGDDTVGVDEGDDEAIILDMNQLNEETQTVFFVVSAFSEKSFGHVHDAYWRLFDGQTKREVARGIIKPSKDASAKIVLRLQKQEKDGLTHWTLKALDEPATGQNIQEVFPEIRALIEA